MGKQGRTDAPNSGPGGSQADDPETQTAGRRGSPALRESLTRVFGETLTPAEAVRRILADVRENGDVAVARWTEKIDGQDIADPAVDPAEWQAAYERIPADLRQSLNLAAERIRAFHARQPIPGWTTRDLGGTFGQRVTPLRRVGVYVPGGSAPLPSSLLMSVIPAKVAGVEEVVVVTPPGRGNGAVPDVVLACAHLASASALYRIGGAQAIGALAFGTQSIPRVDKIVGAGNIFVTLAKQQVFGLVGLGRARRADRDGGDRRRKRQPGLGGGGSTGAGRARPARHGDSAHAFADSGRESPGGGGPPDRKPFAGRDHRRIAFRPGRHRVDARPGKRGARR